MNVEQIKAYFYDNKVKLLREMQATFPEANIVNIDIGGSIKKGTQRPGSDIDIEVHYTGHVTNEEVWYHLIGKFKGYGGDYDIVPVKIQKSTTLKLTISKPQWILIGQKAGWIKTTSK